MKTVITYGTYDLFHTGHYNILKRAKERGDFLIVGVTSDAYDKARGKLNVKQSLSERMENVRKTGLADKIIVEEYMGQKIDDIIKYNVDEFVLGSDWLGKFDYLKEYCEVTYLERTKGVSSTQLRNNQYGILKMGLVGSADNVSNFILESKYVSGLEITSVFSEDYVESKKIYDNNSLEHIYYNYSELLNNVDCIFISSIEKQYEYILQALNFGKHVLFENYNINSIQLKELYNLALKKKLVLFESIYTAYCPGFSRLVSMCKAGTIGEIKSLNIIYSKKSHNINESLVTPYLALSKILGTSNISFDKFEINDRKKDKYVNISIKYDNAIANIQASTNMKMNDELSIIGSSGYIIVDKPWWKTESYVVYTDEKNRKYCFDFDDDGIRYELSDFLNTINTPENYQKVFKEDSIFISRLLNER